LGFQAEELFLRLKRESLKAILLRFSAGRDRREKWGHFTTWLMLWSESVGEWGKRRRKNDSRLFPKAFMFS
jgi:hypothetical protein